MKFAHCLRIIFVILKNTDILWRGKLCLRGTFIGRISLEEGSLRVEGLSRENFTMGDLT